MAAAVRQVGQAGPFGTRLTTWVRGWIAWLRRLHVRVDRGRFRVGDRRIVGIRHRRNRHGELLPTTRDTVRGHAFIDTAMRVAAVFTIAGSSILSRTETGPGWLVAMGYLIGAVILVAINFEA